MPVQTADTLKGWFETGDKPTQAQFYDLIDSCINGVIAIADVVGLIAALALKVDKTQYDAFEQGQLVAVNANYTYVIPEGYLLEKMIVFYGAGGTYMRLSKVAYDGVDVMPETEIAVGWNNPVDLNIFAEGATNLFISGIPAGSKIVFIKRKIKTV